MAAKKRTTKQIVAQDFPGWKVVKESTVRKASDLKAAADAATPPLDEIKAKLAGTAPPGEAAADGRRSVKKKSVKKKSVKKKPVKHAKFVMIAPASQHDALSHQQKVILIRDGKVVAQQG